MRVYFRPTFILLALALVPAVPAWAQSTSSVSGVSSASVSSSVDLDAGDVLGAIALGAGGRDERLVRGMTVGEAFNNDVLVEAEAVGANLRRTDTFDSQVSQSSVFGGDHEGTTFEDSRIRRAEIRGAVIEDSTVWRGSIEDSNVTGSELNRLDVRDSYIADSTLHRVDLLDVTLGPGVLLGRGVRLCNVVMESTGEVIDEDC